MIRSSLTAALFTMAVTLFCLAGFQEHPYFSGSGLASTVIGAAFVLMIAVVVGSGAMFWKKAWGYRLFISAVSAVLILHSVIGAEGLVSDMPALAATYRNSFYWIVFSAAFACAAPCLLDKQTHGFSRFLKRALGLALTLTAPSAIVVLVLTRTEPMAQMAAALIAFMLWFGLSIQSKTFLRDPA